MLLIIDDGTDRFLHAGGTQATIDAAQAASYHLSDALGSVRATTDGTGSVTSTADYDAFGSTRVATGTPGMFGYTGEQSDPSGLTYLRARYADPETGRFLSADSINPSGPGTQGYNRYAYVANNPATWTDPSGHETTASMAATGLANAVVLFALAAIQQASQQVVVGNVGNGLLSSRELTRSLPLMGPIVTALSGFYGGLAGSLLLPDFVTRLLSAALFIISAVLVGTLLYLLIEVFVLLDPFDFFPDARAPSKIIDYTGEQIRGAREFYPQLPRSRGCSTGTVVVGVAEDYILGTALQAFGGGEVSAEDILLAAGIACFSSGNGRGGDDPPKPPKLPKLDLNLLSKSMEKRLEKALQQEGSSIHQLKEELVGRHGSLFDLYVDKKTGAIVLLRKGGIGEPQPTSWNIKELLK